MNKLIYVFLIFMLTSCAATGPIYSTPQLKNAENGGLVLLRESKFLGSGDNSQITVNTSKYILRNGGYVFVELPAGTYQVDQKSPALKNTVNVNIQSGKFSYLLYTPSVGGAGFIGSTSIIPIHSIAFGEISEESALKILPGLRYSEDMVNNSNQQPKDNESL